jgi:hypothetical protein
LVPEATLLSPTAGSCWQQQGHNMFYNIWHKNDKHACLQMQPFALLLCQS